MVGIELLYFALIGIVCGFVVRDRGSKILGNLIFGVLGAIAGGWFFKCLDLFPYSHFVGACAGAILFVGIKRALIADLS